VPGHLERVKEHLPPYAPSRAQFPCPRLLTLAARATLGGARESLLGAVMAARLADAMCPPYPVEGAARRTRAEAARLWLGALTLPAKTRTALLRSFAATAGEDAGAAADALAQVMEVTAPHLDKGARSELVRLSDELRGAGSVLAGPRDRPVV
jgi:hypothetical protein